MSELPGDFTPYKVRPQLRHTVSVRWSSERDGPYPRWSIVCPYRPDDHDKPCRVWAEGHDADNGVYKDGCWVNDSHYAAGWEGVLLTIPDDSLGPTWQVYVKGAGDDGPHLIAVELCEVVE